PRNRRVTSGSPVRDCGWFALIHKMNLHETGETGQKLDLIQRLKGSNHVSLLLTSLADLRKGAGSSSAVRVIKREPGGTRQPGGIILVTPSTGERHGQSGKTRVRR